MSCSENSNCCGTDKLCAITCCPCYLDLEKVKKLVNNPNCICKVCGRVANEKENLCKPEQL